MNYLAKRTKAVGKIFLGAAPSIGFAILFCAIFLGSTFEMRYHYDNFGVVFLPLSIAFALCFYVSPTIANISINSTSHANLFFEGKFYEVFKWGNNNYSFSEKGIMGLAFCIICFFKNLIVCPIVIIFSFIKVFYALFNNDFCEKTISEGTSERKSGHIISAIILLIAILIATPTWLVNYNMYTNRLFKNNITLEYTNVNQSVDTLSDTDDSWEIVFLSFEFNTTAITNDFVKIVGDVTVSDGENTIKAEAVKIVQGKCKVQIRSNSGYEPKSNENNQTFRAIDINRVNITLAIHSIEYENTSLTYKFGEYLLFDIPKNIVEE